MRDQSSSADQKTGWWQRVTSALHARPRLDTKADPCFEFPHSGAYQGSRESRDTPLSAPECSLGHLPIELLSYIFVQCLPNVEFMLPGRACLPLLLSHVCRGWRETAISTPSLWTSLRIEVRVRTSANDWEETFDNESSQRALMRIWLDRSGALPRRISFRTNPAAEVTSECLQILAHLLQNCITLAVNTGPATFAAITRFECPVLSDFRLTVHWESAALFQDVDAITTCGSANLTPSLRVLDMWRIPDAALVRLSAIWMNLVDLKIKDFNPTPEYLQALRSCQSLETCSLIPASTPRDWRHRPGRSSRASKSPAADHLLWSPRRLVGPPPFS
ncbi:hypothetical protein OE88DRAFT_1249439 [Heliocybe sulcata]|uniref:F-box domain-containing protein n=1 Tax=Heliocybe sulcata TaxID=5364 RepID=A0A5C3N7Y0_9AGAM|nr:hypothetical protein OE88DRAFT_1249439 [Heliocybe sulcata]